MRSSPSPKNDDSKGKLEPWVDIHLVNERLDADTGFTSVICLRKGSQLPAAADPAGHGAFLDPQAAFTAFQTRALQQQVHDHGKAHAVENGCRR